MGASMLSCNGRSWGSGASLELLSFGGPWGARAGVGMQYIAARKPAAQRLYVLFGGLGAGGRRHCGGEDPTVGPLMDRYAEEAIWERALLGT